MIARLWTGVVASSDRDAYVAYVRGTGVKEYRRTPGCRQALVLSHGVGGGRSEVVALSVWDDEDSLRTFTGPDIDAMVLYSEDRRYLLDEPTLTHYVVDDGPNGDRPDAPTNGPSPEGYRTGTTPRRIAEAFSSHRFREAYAALAPDVRWVSVGAGEITGRQAVVDACEATLAELATTDAEFLRFVVIADGDRAAVDAVGRYVDGAGGVSVVSSCDVYEFSNGALTCITSYAAEFDPTTGTPA